MLSAINQLLNEEYSVRCREIRGGVEDYYLTDTKLQLGKMAKFGNV